MKKKRRTILTDIFGQPTEQPINQKRKGNRNEVVAARWLKEWTGVEFVRTPSSGGRRLRNASNFCGDVVCCDDNYQFPFTVETKHLKTLAVTEALRVNSEIYTIWKQAKADAQRANKHPMLLVRSNAMKGGVYYCFVSEPVGIVFIEHGARYVSSGVGIIGFLTHQIPFKLDEKLRILLQKVTFGDNG